jgi:hypothetical protein
MVINMKHSTLKTYLHYNPDTGAVHWIKSSSNRALVGAQPTYITSGGYKLVSVQGKHIPLHQLAFVFMVGYVPPQVDHINGNRLDNRWNNLRAATSIVNNRNARKRNDNTSGITGVCWSKKRKYWLASIGNGKGMHQKCFKDYFEACCWRKSMESRLPHYTKRHGS